MTASPFYGSIAKLIWREIRPATPLLLLLVTLLMTTGDNIRAQENNANQNRSSRPNIVIFLADDLGWADLGFRGSPIDTPHLDRLAREGSELYRFYATPICSPTRAALMTGRDPIRLGVVFATILPWLNHGIHEYEHFMSQSFSSAGYQTGIMGKWHLGHSQQQFHPNSRGFDHFYGHLHTEVGYFPPFGSQGGRDFQRNGISIDERGYETYLLADEAVKWIKNRDKNRPFFLYMPFLAPHTPLDAPDELKQKYRDLIDDRLPSRSPADETSRYSKLSGSKSLRAIYAAVVDAMDESIGKVLNTLDEQGLSENTIVLFFSDNGGQVVYGVGGAYNYPLRGGKGETFEGGIRVPALIRWPGRIPAGTRMQQFMTVIDIFPTLASAAGIKILADRKMDGLDMWPAISQNKQIRRKDPVIFASETPIYGSIDFAVFSGDWKLVQQMERDQDSIVITNLLFDIQEDPLETNNLAAAEPRQVRKMHRWLKKWRSLYPISGVRSELVPPPGWRAPKDWANYPKRYEILQPQASSGIMPAYSIRALDFQYGARGRLIYDCEPLPLIGGGFCWPGSGVDPINLKRKD